VLGKQGKLGNLAVSLYNEVEILDQPVLNRLEKNVYKYMDNYR